MFFNHQELVNQIEDSNFELELQKKLNSLDENESFAIIYELIDHDNSLVRRFGLSLLSKMSWNQDNLVTFLEKGFLLRNPSEIRYWFVAIVPQLGVQPIFELLNHYLEIEPDIANNAKYVPTLAIKRIVEVGASGSLLIVDSTIKIYWEKELRRSTSSFSIIPPSAFCLLP
jgi:hypothetical protein